MERKLELADIAGYLPYGLKLTVDKSNRDEFGIYSVRDLERIANNTNIISFADKKYIVKGGTEFYQYSYLYFKPVLRPMSDLVKPMTHPDINGGEEFVPKNYMSDNLITDAAIGDTVSFYNFHMKGLQSEQYYCDWNIVLSFLSKLHFDYNDLISKGLAIDINTLK